MGHINEKPLDFNKQGKAFFPVDAKRNRFAGGTSENVHIKIRNHSLTFAPESKKIRSVERGFPRRAIVFFHQAGGRNLDYQSTRCNPRNADRRHHQDGAVL